jgi:hypothetical protein
LQRRRALERSDSQSRFQTHSRSKTVAKPCPTPMQRDAMPREAPVRAIWWISVVARRAPLQPSGGTNIANHALRLADVGHLTAGALNPARAFANRPNTV